MPPQHPIPTNGRRRTRQLRTMHLSVLEWVYVLYGAGREIGNRSTRTRGHYSSPFAETQRFCVGSELLSRIRIYPLRPGVVAEFALEAASTARVLYVRRCRSKQFKRRLTSPSLPPVPPLEWSPQRGGGRRRRFMFVEEKECKGTGRGMATATAASMEVGPWVGRPSSLSRTQETGGGGKARPRKDPGFLLPQYKICIVYLVSLPLSSSRPFLDSTTRYITRRQGGRGEGAETRPQLPLLSSLGDFGSRGLRGDEREKERPLNSRKAPPSPSFCRYFPS